MAPLNTLVNHISVNELSDLCFTKECIAAASDLLQSMNMNADPCSDFYQYVCGGWIESRNIPEDLEDYGIMEETSSYYKERIRGVLEGPYENLLSLTLSKESFIKEEEEDIDSENFQQVKMYYESCVDVNGGDSNDRLKSFFQDYLNFNSEVTSINQHLGMFIINSKVMNQISYPRSNDATIIEISGLLSIELMYDDDDRSKITLAVYPPLDFENKEAGILQENGQQKLFELASSLFGSTIAGNRDVDRIETLKDLGMDILSTEEVFKMVELAISVEKKLFRLSESQKYLEYVTYTSDDFVKSFSFIDLEEIILANVPEYKTMPELIIQVYNERYLYELDYTMGVEQSNTVLNKNSILNYLNIHKILYASSILDAETRKFTPDLPFQTRSSICIDKTLDNLGHAAGRVFSMISSSEEDRLNLEKIADNVQNSLGRLIKKSNWLDRRTKEAAINKLNKVKLLIGYSIESPDVRSPKEIKEYLRGLKINDNFYENEKSIQKWISNKYWKMLGEVTGPPDWNGVPGFHHLVAMNLLSKNSIYISAAYGQKPYYDKSYPDYFNYGGIGHTIAHEYSHTFDESGLDFDENGLIRNWWTKSSRNKYLKKKKCFIDQYSSDFIEDEEGERYFVDGAITFGENMADNLGLSVSYDAYMNSLIGRRGYNPALPGLQDYSLEALFFISAGRGFCSKSSESTMNSMVKGAHSPDSIRANKMFQNSKDFSRVFKCPVGSKMNPVKKCNIW